MNYNHETIRAQLRARREALEITQEELSLMLGRSPGFIHKMEADPHRSTLMMSSLVIWAGALGGTITIAFPGDEVA